MGGIGAVGIESPCLNGRKRFGAALPFAAWNEALPPVQSGEPVRKGKRFPYSGPLEVGH